MTLILSGSVLRQIDASGPVLTLIIKLFSHNNLRTLARVFLSAWKPVSLLLFAIAVLPATVTAQDTLTGVLQQVLEQLSDH